MKSTEPISEIVILSQNVLHIFQQDALIYFLDCLFSLEHFYFVSN